MLDVQTNGSLFKPGLFDPNCKDGEEKKREGPEFHVTISKLEYNPDFLLLRWFDSQCMMKRWLLHRRTWQPQSKHCSISMFRCQKFQNKISHVIVLISICKHTIVSNEHFKHHPETTPDTNTVDSVFNSIRFNWIFICIALLITDTVTKLYRNLGVDLDSSGLIQNHSKSNIYAGKCSCIQCWVTYTLKLIF